MQTINKEARKTNRAVASVREEPSKAIKDVEDEEEGIRQNLLPVKNGSNNGDANQQQSQFAVAALSDENPE